MNGKFEASVGASRCPLQHGQVAVGVSSCQDRPLTDMRADRDGLLGSVVERRSLPLTSFGPSSPMRNSTDPTLPNHPMGG